MNLSSHRELFHASTCTSSIKNCELLYFEMLVENINL